MNKYEIICDTEEGRKILNNKTKKIYHNEFEIIEEKDKEIERLKQREKECIEHYLVASKYGSKMESKVIELNNIINELENMTIKELEEYNNLNGMVRGSINGYHYCKLLHRYLDKLQELKGSDK